MDKNEYRRRLEELVIVKDRKPAKSPTHNRLAKQTVVEYDEDGNEIEVEREITENPTLGFDIKLKDRTSACELGCGDIVTNQVIERRLCTHPQPHWRIKCQTCGCFVSPDGQGFIDNAHVIQSEYVRYFRTISEKEPKKTQVSSSLDK